MHHVTVRQINVSTEPEHLGTPYFLRVDQKGQDLGSGFLLLLTDGQDAWRGEVNEAVVCRDAEELEMQKDRYLQDLQLALTGTGTSSTEYSLSLSPAQPRPGSDVTLAYEKVQKDISFRLGSVLLSAVPEPVEAVRELLVHGLERGNTLDRHNQKLQQENHTLRQELQHITAELKRYALGKEALEKDLYSRFILVLNEKKAKIRSLQQKVSGLEEAREEQRKGSKTEQQPPEDEEDVYGGSTDEEGEQATPTLTPTPASVSTSPARGSGSPSPLVGSLNDITDVAPCRKRRFRHLGPPEVAKKTTSDISHRRRRESPVAASTAAANQEQAQQRSTDAKTTGIDAEDLFEDF